MEEREFRWCKDLAIHKILSSLAGWFMIIGFPGAFVWLISMDKPHERLVGAGVVGLILVCWAFHSRKYWQRISDRTPQLILGRDSLRAAQLHGEEIRWEDVRSLSGWELKISRDASKLDLLTTRGTVKLDLTGLDAPMSILFKEIEARCNAYQAPAAKADGVPELHFN